MMAMTLLVLLEQLGLQPVTVDDLKALELPIPGGTELYYRDMAPKAGLGDQLEAEGAEERLRAALGDPIATPFGPGWWLFSFDTAPHCGFAFKASGNRVVLREWSAAQFRGWTREEARPLTTAIMKAIESKLR